MDLHTFKKFLTKPLCPDCFYKGHSYLKRWNISDEKRRGRVLISLRYNIPARQIGFVFMSPEKVLANFKLGVAYNKTYFARLKVQMGDLEQ